MAAKATLYVTRKLPDAVLARAARDYDARLNVEDVPPGPDGLVAGAAGMDAILCTSADRFDAELIGRLPARVRIVSTFSVGLEHIDLAAARERGLIIANTPDVLTGATADIAILLLLGAARRAGEGERMIRDDAWKDWTPTQMLGTEFSGKRLGIVGMGRIGQAVAKRAAGFDMEIHYHNRRELPAAQAHGATYHADLDAMLPLCDFLSLHCPLTPETLHLLNADRLARLPDGAVVVNTARGSVVDDEALIAALRSGKLAAAGLDVFDGEPAINPAYRALPNTFLLPHLGSATVETRNAMGFRALDNIDAVMAGSPSNTSRPAAASLPERRAAISALSSTTLPRAVLTTTAPSGSRARRSAFSRCSVSGVNGQWSDRKSQSGSMASRSA
ncbi:MAG: D-glycerate dehydrogenase [Inquilinus sp.]|nr:D-glycerate dehydrogenase [Inquilinus sp.]